MKSHRPRILTRLARRSHIAKATRKEQGRDHRELVGDLATVNSNYMHNPDTGHHEFAKDTPAWIVSIAARRKWISTVGHLEHA